MPRAGLIKKQIVDKRGKRTSVWVKMEKGARSNKKGTPYVFDRSRLHPLIKNARKWKKLDFEEEYVYMNDISVAHSLDEISTGYIKEGDKVMLTRDERDGNGKRVYNKKTGILSRLPYKEVVVSKDYGTKHWGFIMDNTKELQKEAGLLWEKNKTKPKPTWKKSDKTIVAYHASNKKFKKFEYGNRAVSGGVGSDVGFFFFTNKKNADYYTKVLKDNHGQAYLYKVQIRLGKTTPLRGDEIGTNWARHAELTQQEIEGSDTVVISDADTGYGITEEVVVFDDDNIMIDTVSKL